MLLSFTPWANAETIHLNDGSSVEGKIIEKTAQSVKIKVDGMVMVYYSDEIWDIDGVPFVIKKNSTAKQAPGALDSLYHQMFKQATDAFIKGDYVLSEQMSQQAIAINPKPEAYNNLSMAQYNQGKYQEAAANYYKAVGLGLKPDLTSEKAMRPYWYRELLVKSPYGPQIPFKGKTNCSDFLIHNIFRTILSKLDDPRDVILVRPEFTQFSQNGKDFTEQWMVEGKSGTKIFSIFLSQTIEGDVDYNVVEKLNNSQALQFGDLSDNPASISENSSVDHSLSSLGSIFIDGRQWSVDRYSDDKNNLSITFSPQGGGDEELIYGVQNFQVEEILYDKGLLGSWSNAIWQSLYPECFDRSQADSMSTDQLGLSGGQLQFSYTGTVTTDGHGVSDEQGRFSGKLMMKSNISENLIKDAQPKYIINDFQCPARPHDYKIARFETDPDTGSMLMLMYRGNSTMPLEIKNKWAQNLDLYELRDNLDIKLIIQKIKDQHAQ